MLDETSIPPELPELSQVNPERRYLKWGTAIVVVLCLAGLVSVIMLSNLKQDNLSVEPPGPEVEPESLEEVLLQDLLSPLAASSAVNYSDEELQQLKTDLNTPLPESKRFVRQYSEEELSGIMGVSDE